MAQRSPHQVQRMPITQARINLGQLARRTHVNKEYFILEKDGIANVQAAIRQSNVDIKAGRVRRAEVLLKPAKRKHPIKTPVNVSASVRARLLTLSYATSSLARRPLRGEQVRGREMRKQASVVPADAMNSADVH